MKKDLDLLELNIQLFGEENADNVDTDTTENEAENETAENKQISGNADENEKTLTQAEANEFVEKRLARERKKYPSKEELDEFKKWKEDKKTESEKQAEKEKEYQKTISERDDLKKENLLLRKGVKDDDIDYVLFKVSKMEGEFEDNLNDFLEKNPKYLGKDETKETKTVDLSSEHTEENTKDDTLARKVMGLI